MIVGHTGFISTETNRYVHVFFHAKTSVPGEKKCMGTCCFEKSFDGKAIVPILEFPGNNREVVVVRQADGGPLILQR